MEVTDQLAPFRCRHCEQSPYNQHFSKLSIYKYYNDIAQTSYFRFGMICRDLGIKLIKMCNMNSHVDYYVIEQNMVNNKCIFKLSLPVGSLNGNSVYVRRYNGKDRFFQLIGEDIHYVSWQAW